MNYLKRLLPILGQVSDYRRDRFQSDLSAGLTVGVMLIPQGMAYALIAGLPPIYGLYAALVPIIIYALFGTSRQLAVGPVAMVSLLVAAGVAPMANGDAERYIQLALLLSLMVGVIQFALGLARFGFLTTFLSHPVLAGFTSAAALIIGLSQLKHLLGVPIPRSNYIHEILWEAIQQIGSVHVPTLLLGVAGIVLLAVLKRWKRIPGPLVVVVIGTLAVWGFSLQEGGMQIVGDVPGGLPMPTVPPISLADLEALLPIALTIALVGFMESIAVAKVYASKNRYEVDANRELVGLGLANLIGAFFRAYPTTGGFSRTAVNAQAGAQTTVASLFSAGVIALTLLFLTPLFYYMPNAVLAAIVMVAVFGLIDWQEARFLWKTDRRDLALMGVTFLATLGLGIEEGILVGVIVSLVLVIQQSSRPHTAIIGRLPDTETYRNVERNPDALVNQHVAILRMDASLYFANVMYFKEQVQQLCARSPELRAVVFDAYPMNRIDSTAAHALKEIVADLHASGIAFYLAGVKGPVMDKLKKAGVAELIGPEYFYHEVHEAAQAAEAAMTPRGTAKTEAALADV